MINHVVLFKLKEYPAEEKIEILAELKESLLGLKDKIAKIKYLEVGVNHELETSGYDIVLLSHFETMEDLDTYRVHPDHKKVVERIMETTVSRAAADYNF
ncbi:MAG: Dabb family protein [Bacteroidota bacterium]